MENIDLRNIKMIWGNYAFDSAISHYVGSSRGILYAWDPCMFREENVTMSNYFVAVTDKWNGEVIMGDFNEVRTRDERFGSCFHQQGAAAFNLFIALSGLMDLPLGDQGDNDVDLVAKRMTIMKSLHDIETIESIELSQKAKLEEVEFPNRITIDQRMDMERDITHDKIKKAVWDRGFDKSPVDYFFQHGQFPKGGNSSFIALIPKTQEAKMVKDFRPISLIGSVYKIIAKILANRLCGVLGDIVNEVQSAFVANRQILDDPFMLNELISWYKSKKTQTMIFKVDFEKAYDSVCWDYLDDVLKRFGFGDKCLNLSFQRVNAGIFKGVCVGSSLKLSHLFYADDKIFMGQWCKSNISTIVQVLQCFYRASGIRINVHKSKLVGIGVLSNQVEQAASHIRCLTFTPSFSYLGVKVGGMMSRISTWNEVIQRLLDRLSKWKMKMLSIGGRGKFFNGMDLNEKKMAWVIWSNVLASKQKGGLGVSSFYALNRALLFKWVWRFRSQNSSLWACFIKAIHGDDGHLISMPKVSRSSIWLDIVRKVFHLKHQGDCPLKDQYPRLYKLEAYNNVSVENKIGSSNFCDSFRRLLRGGAESEQFNELSSKLSCVTLPQTQDRWVWSLEGTSEFSMASIRKALDDFKFPEVSSQTRWISVVSGKINIFAWKVKLDKIPASLNLSLRGLDIEYIFCPLCSLYVESSSLLLFACSLVKSLAHKIMIWWDISLMDFGSYEE
ncbi:RNA-directed DNA polymerase, eukaryota, reverse transcriptase zinc-binding domain protein [Tanacetum coccineum]